MADQHKAPRVQRVTLVLVGQRGVFLVESVSDNLARCDRAYTFVLFQGLTCFLPEVNAAVPDAAMGPSEDSWGHGLLV